MHRVNTNQLCYFVRLFNVHNDIGEIRNEVDAYYTAFFIKTCNNLKIAFYILLFFFACAS
jgi:hypothetical protein